MPPSAVLQTLTHVWPIFKQAQIPVAVAGGVALSYWGNPRSTQDIDLALLTDDLDLVDRLLTDARLLRTSVDLQQLGFFQLSQWVFEPQDQYVTVEVDLLISNSEYYVAAMARSESVSLEGVPTEVSVLSREDLILHKLFAQRLIDQADVAMLIEMHREELDRDYLETWAERLGLSASLKRAFESRFNGDA